MAYLSKKKNFAKDAQKSPTVARVFENIFCEVEKKTNDFFLCLHCLVLWKLLLHSAERPRNEFKPKVLRNVGSGSRKR